MSLLHTLARQSLAQFVIVYGEVFDGSAIPPEELDALMWAKMCAKEANVTPVGFKIPFDNIRRAKVTLPYLPDLINYTGCCAIKKNGGLYTPCCGKVVEDTVYCKTCSVDKEGETKELEFGAIEDRDSNVEEELFAPISFGEWMRGHKTTLPEVYEKLKAAGIPLEIPARELTVRELPKRRKGRPTRSEDSVEDEDSVPKTSKAKKAKASESESDAPKAKKTKAKKAESEDEAPKAKKTKAKKAESESESDAPKAKKAPKASEDEAPKAKKASKKAESEDEAPKAKKASKKAESEDEAPKAKKASKVESDSGSDSDAKAKKAAKKAAKAAAEAEAAEAEAKAAKKAAKAAAKAEAEAAAAKAAKATAAKDAEELEEEEEEIEGDYEQDCTIDDKEYNLRNGKIICDKENGEILGTLNEDGEPEWNSEKR